MSSPEPGEIPAFIMRLPDEILSIILNEGKDRFYREDYTLSRKQRRQAAVCQRFRRILVGDNYHTFRSNDSQCSRLLPLFEILPFHGGLVHTLDLWIQPMAPNILGVTKRRKVAQIIDPGLELLVLLDGLARTIPHLVNLRTFRLRIRSTPHPFARNGYRGYTSSSPTETMGSAEMTSLVKCFENLSPLLEDLELYEFTWKDASRALCATVSMPNVHRLVLSLHLPLQPDMEHAAFMDHFPGVKELHIPGGHRSPQGKWFSRAFGASKIQQLLIGWERDWSSSHGNDASIEGVAALCASSSSSLQTIRLFDASFPSHKVAQYLSNVDDITVEGVNFGYGDYVEFDEFIGSLATLPSLKSLRLSRCSDIPIDLAKWFVPDHPRVHFPALQVLEAGSMETIADEEDIEGAGPDDFEEGRHWRGAERRALEDTCEKMGIKASFDWEFFSPAADSDEDEW